MRTETETVPRQPPARLRAGGSDADNLANYATAKAVNNWWERGAFLVAPLPIVCSAFLGPHAAFLGMGVVLAHFAAALLARRRWRRCPLLVLRWYFGGILDDVDSPRFAAEYAAGGGRRAVRALARSLLATVSAAILAGAVLGFALGVGLSYRTGLPITTPLWWLAAIPVAYVALWAGVALWYWNRLKFSPAEETARE